jgi:DNA-binding NarL/FixJ family response regulator
VVATGFIVPETDHKHRLLEPLIEREQEILQELAYGLRMDQIAQKLIITEGTVKSHVHGYFKSLALVIERKL